MLPPFLGYRCRKSEEGHIILNGKNFAIIPFDFFLLLVSITFPLIIAFDSHAISESPMINLLLLALTIGPLAAAYVVSIDNTTINDICITNQQIIVYKRTLLKRYHSNYCLSDIEAIVFKYSRESRDFGYMRIFVQTKKSEEILLTQEIDLFSWQAKKAYCCITEYFKQTHRHIKVTAPDIFINENFT